MPTTPQETADVCLVLMPYADVERPSLGLGLLKAVLKKQGIAATVLYPNLWYAETIGLDMYTMICNSPVENLMGEWTFAGLAFPEFEPDQAAYLRLILQPTSEPSTQPGRLGSARAEAEKKLLEAIRQGTPKFIERVAQAVLKLQPRIVGCSSTFQQHCASLALLRRIRELNPEIITVLGGGNCEGAMGQATHHFFPWVDYVVSGEADHLFGDLCRNLLAKGRALELKELPYGVIGPAHRCRPDMLSLSLNGGTTQPAPRAIVHNLDQIPLPDFDDYFQTLRVSPIASYVKPGLSIETSRGCWWGDKHHCTFCGLNGSSMGFRSKSPDRVLAEFEQLSQRYGLAKFQVVDNILDMRYLETVLPSLAASSQPYALFYETKANLRREQLEKLAGAGIRVIQPGIENMHDSVLKLLDKGNTTLMNIQLLKWALELGIHVIWNFLVNVPGEQDEWYVEIAQWLPLISHLQPPGSMSKIRYDRFSPYYERPADYGIKIRPYRTYSYVYPLPLEALAELAYFFEDDLDSAQAALNPARNVSGRPGLAALQTCLNQWAESWQRPRWFQTQQRPVLSMVDAGTYLTITDTRPCAVGNQFSLEGLAYQVYLACNQALTPKALTQALGLPDHSWQKIEPVVAELCERKLLLSLNGRLLSLAVKEPCQPFLKEHPGGEVNVLEYIKLRRFMSKVTALT